jgi:hypothetical protein
MRFHRLPPVILERAKHVGKDEQGHTTGWCLLAPTGVTLRLLVLLSLGSLSSCLNFESGEDANKKARKPGH